MDAPPPRPDRGGGGAPGGPRPPPRPGGEHERGKDDLRLRRRGGDPPRLGHPELSRGVRGPRPGGALPLPRGPRGLDPSRPDERIRGEEGPARGRRPGPRRPGGEEPPRVPERTREGDPPLLLAPGALRRRLLPPVPGRGAGAGARPPPPGRRLPHGDRRGAPGLDGDRRGPQGAPRRPRVPPREPPPRLPDLRQGGGVPSPELRLPAGAVREPHGPREADVPQARRPRARHHARRGALRAVLPVRALLPRGDG